MSIRENPGRYKGLRVRRQIPGEARPRVMYFSYYVSAKTAYGNSRREATDGEKAGLWMQAFQMDEQWEEDQRVAKLKEIRVFDPFHTRSNTGVKGIMYKMRLDARGYRAEGFCCSLQHKGRRYSAEVRLSRRTWKDGWRQAVEYLAHVRAIGPQQVKAMMRAIPDESALRIKT